MKALRVNYKKVTGKTAFNGWKAEELTKKIEDFTAEKAKTTDVGVLNEAALEAGKKLVSTPRPKTVEEVKEKLKTEEDLLPKLPKEEKTDKEAIAELNKDSNVPEPKTVDVPRPDVPSVDDSKPLLVNFTEEVGLVSLISFTLL